MSGAADTIISQSSTTSSTTTPSSSSLRPPSSSSRSGSNHRSQSQGSSLHKKSRNKAQTKGEAAVASAQSASSAVAAAVDDGVVVLEYPSVLSSSDPSHSQQQQQQSSSSNTPTAHDPLSSPPNLSCLTNESSSYTDVAQLCFQLTQFAGQPPAQQEEAAGAKWLLLPDDAYAERVTAAWDALTECLQRHADRRCRILASQVLAVTARAAYARLRPSTLLSGSKPARGARLPQLVGSDVATVLVTAALEDADDGVAAAALSALGRLILSTQEGHVVQDDLTRTLLGLMYPGSSRPYAPSLSAVTDEDPAVAWQELFARVVENVLSPRLLPLVERVLLFPSSTAQAAALPCLTAALVHLVQVHPGTLFQMGQSKRDQRLVYSKRWMELDAAGLIDTGMLAGLLLPSLMSSGSSSSGNGPHAAALAALRLAAAQHNSNNSLRTVAPWCVTIWKEELSAFANNNSSSSSSSRGGGGTGTTEARLSRLAALLVALRAVPVGERVRTLTGTVADAILALPSTLAAPTAASGALRVVQQSVNNGSKTTSISYRRPARVALWTEVAISLFLDGPSSPTPTSNNNKDPHRHSRHECLRTFLSCPAIASVVAEDGDHHHHRGVLSPRDELLLAFTATALQAGRRLRVTADDTLQVADPQAAAVQEWIQLVGVVLQSFLATVVSPPPVTAEGAAPAAYLDEDLSLRTAGLASYVQLLQEYLHFVGLLHPPSSVALKLGANACPPHIWWDRLTESASFLSRFDTTTTADADAQPTTNQLMDELVARELRPGGDGIPSHHVRLFVLSLAADHWVQGRIAVIRQSMAAGTNNIKPADLNLPSAREILRALAPKRLLAKISQTHVPPVDSDGKPKRDPIKKLALENVRVSVACIESIALMACDWRRRFGSSQETKHIMSVAVGLLQGKGDATPLDDLMKSVLGPTCEAAVGRIHAFYENASKAAALGQSFPVSDLVTQQVKIKIKPLVSSSKLSPRPTDDVMREYLVQLCRQIVDSRIQLAVLASPPADSLLTPARPANWLRLSVPPIPAPRDGRLYGCRGEAVAAWGHCVKDCSTPSDPAQLVVAYVPRRYLRYDGEDDFRVTVLMRVHNMTPMDFFDGVRLELGLVQQDDDDDDDDDPETAKFVESLGGTLDDLTSDLPLSSAEVIYKQELKSGENITWEVTLNDLQASNSLKLVPSVVYRNVPVEAEDAGAKGPVEPQDTENKSGEDDFQVQVTGADDAAKSFKAEQAGIEQVRLTGEPLTLPPLIVFQPCPLVFFTDRCGDMDSFRFLWFRFPHQLAPMKVAAAPKDQRQSEQTVNPMTRKIAKMAALTWEGEAIPGGVATNLWAFMTLAGHRAYCVLTENDDQTQQSLHFRGDDRKVLFSLAGSKSSRESVVASMLPGMVPVG